MGAVSLVIQQYHIISLVFYTYSSLQNYTNPLLYLVFLARFAPPVLPLYYTEK